MMNHTRRRLLAAIPLASLAACTSFKGAGGATKVSALFCGQVNDGGFMQAGYQGLMLARQKLGVQTAYIDKIPNETGAQVVALRELARARPALIIAHGGQNNKAVEQVAAEFPDISFVVTQGHVTGANLSSYDVLQEESAWLAGAYAAMMTRTGVVGHQSGIRVPPGLRGRAAYADGVHTANPKVRLLTNFSGNQDDVALAERVTRAQAKQGADIIFTMLNAGRSGTTEACRALGIHEIGNVADWVARDPQVFIASAYADVGIGVFQAAEDFVQKRFKPGEISKVGLQNDQAVRLIMADNTPAAVRRKIEGFRQQILNGQIRVRTEYSGPEFKI
jgi:basic membrane protein A